MWFGSQPSIQSGPSSEYSLPASSDDSSSLDSDAGVCGLRGSVSTAPLARRRARSDWAAGAGAGAAKALAANGSAKVDAAAVAAAPRRVAVAVDEPAAGRSTRQIKLYLLRRSSRRRAASLADMGRTSASRGRAHVVTSVTWLK